MGSSKHMHVRSLREFSCRAVIVLVLTLNGCSSISGKRVTNETRTSVAAQVAGSSLDASEKAAYLAANQRAENGDYDVTDKTVAQIISDERSFEAEKASEEAQAEKLVADARAKKAALDRQLRSALSVGLVSKGYHEADYMNQDYQSKILVTLILKNRGTKAIRSFKGITHFENSVGDDIQAIPLVYEHGLAPSASSLYDGTFDFNQYEQSEVRLKEADIRNVHLRWEPQLIIFQDGSRLVADSSGS